MATFSLVGSSGQSGLTASPPESTDANGNLIGAGSGAAINPLLGPLADNGGATWTHALLAGSPAINAGDASAVAGVGDVPSNDQRGAPFVRVFGGRIDIGAVEQQDFAAPLDLVVDTLSDVTDGDYSAGNLSLREAVGLANGNIGFADAIRFNPSLTADGPATILLTHGELNISESLTITGPGAERLTVDASGSDPTPELNNGDGSRIFEIVEKPQAIQVSIGDVCLTGGDVAGDGRAILRGWKLVLFESRNIQSHEYRRESCCRKRRRCLCARSWHRHRKLNIFR